MFTIEGVERLLGTDALTRSGWLLLRATQSSEGQHVCALVEIVSSKLPMKSALGILAPIFAARLATETDAGMTCGASSFLFASEEREIGVLARRDRIVFVLVAPASSVSVRADLAAAHACEHVDVLLADVTKIMDKIALASADSIDLSKLPASWLNRRTKPMPKPDPYDNDDSDDSDDSDDEGAESRGDRPLTPMTRKEWHQQLDGIARAIGASPAAFRAGVKAQILARDINAVPEGIEMDDVDLQEPGEK